VTSLIERAFELARSGECKSVTQVERRLSRDGFSFAAVQGQIGPPLIRRQLSTLCRTSPSRSVPATSAA
jgi:hypothetical protein